MARVSKEHILGEVGRLTAANGGVPLGQRKFAEVSGIPESAWKGVYWARWSDAITEAGHKPNSWGTEKHDDETLLMFLADGTRRYGHFPTEPELRMWKRNDVEVAHPAVFRERFGSKAEQVRRLLQFAKERSELSDVAAIIAPAATAPPPKVAKTDRVVVGVVYLLRMSSYYKVGKSNDPGRRMYELAIQLPEKHDLVHAIETDDPGGIEAYWHRRFGRKQTNGEWFALSADDVAAFMSREYM